MNTPNYEGKVTVGIELITPQIAQNALRFNDSNRKLSRDRVNDYKRDMLADKWCLNGESISFYETGELKDGQHRLTAIAETGKAQWMVVARNIPRGVVLADRGKTRGTTNILEMAGYPAAVRQTNMVGAINTLHRYIAGMWRITDSEIEAFIQKYSPALTAAWSACCNGSSAPLSRKSSVIAAVFSAIYSGVSTEAVTEFCKVVNSGFCESDKQYAAIVLRNYLLQHGTSAGQGERNNCMRIAMLAIEDFVAERPRRRAYDPGKTSKYYTAVAQGIFHKEA